MRFSRDFHTKSRGLRVVAAVLSAQTRTLIGDSAHSNSVKQTDVYLEALQLL